MARARATREKSEEGRVATAYWKLRRLLGCRKRKGGGNNARNVVHATRRQDRPAWHGRQRVSVGTNKTVAAETNKAADAFMMAQS